MTTTPSEPIVLAGRTFRLVGRRLTFERDLYIGRALRETGFAEAFSGLATTPDLDRQRAALLLNAHSSGRACALLAGLLGEDEVVWSEEVAAKTERFFKDLDDPVDKQTLLETLVVWVGSFFLNGLGSSRISPSSSGSAAATAPPATGTGGAPAPTTSRRRRTGARSTSGHGTASS